MCSAKTFIIIVCFITILPLRCQIGVWTADHSHRAHGAVQQWLRSLWFSVAQWLHCVGKSAKFCGCFFLAHEPAAPRHRKKWAQQASVFSSAPFYLKWALEREKKEKNTVCMEMAGVVVNAYELPFCFQMLYKYSSRLMFWEAVWWQGDGGGRWRRRRPTRSEEEHSHGAVVLSLSPPAEGYEGHQKRHQSRHGAGHQEHQRGNLPVCGNGTHTRRLEREESTHTHTKARLLNWSGFADKHENKSGSLRVKWVRQNKLRPARQSHQEHT